MSSLGARLFQRMHEAYHPDGVEGACEFEITGARAEIFHVLLNDGRISFGHGAHPDPGCRVRISSTIASFLHAGAEDIDFRSPTLMRHLEVRGHADLAFALGLLLRRPSAQTLAKFQNASQISSLKHRSPQVEYLTSPSAAAVAQCLAEEQPAIVRGALDHWPLPRSLEDLLGAFGDCVLSVDTRVVRHRRIADLISAMRGRDSMGVYTHGCEIPVAMQRAFPPPFFTPRRAPVAAQLWMGHGGGGNRPVTLLHRDDLHGLLAQIYGSKTIILYSPDQSDCLYPSKAFNRSQSCHVDPTAPDLLRYPLFERARALQVRLGPGEILVNPLGWFHCVLAEGPVVSLSYSFDAVSGVVQE